MKANVVVLTFANKSDSRLTSISIPYLEENEYAGIVRRARKAFGDSITIAIRRGVELSAEHERAILRIKNRGKDGGDSSPL